LPPASLGQQFEALVSLVNNTLTGQAMRDHEERGHRPYDNRCQSCVEAAQRRRTHKRGAGSSSLGLSVDLTGPHPRSVTGDTYMLVGVLRYQKASGNSSTGTEVTSMKVTLVEDEEQKVGQEDVEVAESAEGPAEVHWTPGVVESAVQESGEPDEAVDEDEEAVPVSTIYYCLPLPNKTSTTVFQHVQELVAKALHDGGLTRFHSDKGGEFNNQLISKWLMSRGITRTFSCTGEPQSNSFVERAIGLLKSEARTMMLARNLDDRYWSLAMAHAAGLRRLQVLGKQAK